MARISELFLQDLEYRAEFQNGAPVWTNEYSRRPSIYKVCILLAALLPLCSGAAQRSREDCNHREWAQMLMRVARVF